MQSWGNTRGDLYEQIKSCHRGRSEDKRAKVNELNLTWNIPMWLKSHPTCSHTIRLTLLVAKGHMGIVFALPNRHHLSDISTLQGSWVRSAVKKMRKWFGRKNCISRKMIQYKWHLSSGRPHCSTSRYQDKILQDTTNNLYASPTLNLDLDKAEHYETFELPGDDTLDEEAAEVLLCVEQKSCNRSEEKTVF